MQSISFGENIPSRGTTYLRVKQKGDQIRFRIVKDPSYEGKHFTQTETGWNVTLCPRINNQEDCDLCELFFQKKAEAKKLKEVDSVKAKELEREARKYACSTIYYFPVLNRDTGLFGILQTTAGVRAKLNTQYEAGVAVFERDWILRNTGSTNPNEVYSLIPVDSADTKEFTPQEVVEYEKGLKFDFSSISDNSTQDELE